MTNIEIKAAESLSNLHKDLSKVSESIKRIPTINEQQFYLDLSRNVAAALIPEYNSLEGIPSKTVTLTNAIFDEVMVAFNKKFNQETN